MEPKSTAFVIIMVAIAIIAVIVWLVYLVIRRKTPSSQQNHGKPEGSRWYEYLLATILLAVLAVVVVWLLFSGIYGNPAGDGDSAGENWRSGIQAIVFVTVFAAAAGLGLLVFLIYLITPYSRHGKCYRY